MVFRASLRPLLRLLMLALPGCLAAGPALAQPELDVTEVLFTRTIARTSEGQDTIRAEIRVKGAGITGATITVPSAPNTPLPLGEDPDADDEWLVGGDFATEAELDMVLTDGNYVLRLNNNTVMVTLPYTRPAVPSPDIDEPEARERRLPGPVEVVFTPCGAPCAQANDSVEALLEDEALGELASETLDETAGSWIPGDDMGGDLALGENLELLVTIAHTAVRDNNGIFIEDADGFFLFRHVFVQSDEVGFRTGFAPPEGDFCVVVNPAVPAPECTQLDDPLLFLLDTGGMVATTVAGRDVDYTFTVDSKGTVTGSAMADLDDNGSKETLGAIKGKLKGKGGELSQKLSFPLVNEGLPAKLKVSVSDVLSIPSNTRARTQKASGSLGAMKVKEEDVTNGALPFPPLGWRVDFTIAPDGSVQDGLLTLESGRSFDLAGALKFNLGTNESRLKLETADKGIKLQLKKVTLDDEVSPTAVVGGDLSYKILGQSGKAELPAP